MSNPLDRLVKVQDKSNNEAQTRRNYKRFIDRMREQGWSDADVSEYGALVKTLMGSDDRESLALYPAGTFASAHEARDSARSFWRQA